MSGGGGDGAPGGGRLALGAVTAHLGFVAVGWYATLAATAAGPAAVLAAIGLALVAGAAGLVWLRACARSALLPRGRVLLVGALLALLHAATPPFLSADLWDYLARGRLEVLGFDPYTVTVEQHAADPRLAPFAARAAWPFQTMPYGAAMAVLQRLCALPDVPFVGAALWKCAAACAHLATATVLERAALAAGGDEHRARRVLVAWAWQPWLLLECVGAAHNEVFLALLAALGLLALARARAPLAGAWLSATALVKHCLPAMAPAVLALAWRRRALVPLLLGTVPTLAALALAWWTYWREPGGLVWLQDQSSVARNSLVALAANLLFHRAGTIVRAVGTLLLLLLLVVTARRVVDLRSCARIALLTMVVFLFLWTPSFRPWYHLWWLPLWALAQAPAADRALAALAFCGPLAYLVQVGTAGYGTAHQVWLFACADAVPSLLVLCGWRALAAPANPAPPAQPPP